MNGKSEFCQTITALCAIRQSTAAQAELGEEANESDLIRVALKRAAG